MTAHILEFLFLVIIKVYLLQLGTFLHDGREACIVYMVQRETDFYANLVLAWKSNLANSFKYSCQI